MAQLAEVLHYTELERLNIDKQSNLLGQLISYEENEVLRIQAQMARSSKLGSYILRPSIPKLH